MADTGIVIAAVSAAFSGAAGAFVGAFATLRAANLETKRTILEYRLRRRSERQETYKVAIDLLTDWGWQGSIPNYDVVREFNIPFVHAANHVRVYGSPASIAAMDEIQEGIALLNRANETKLAEAYAEAYKAIWEAHSHFVIAARADVGPRKEDELPEVPFRQGAGPRA
jgi:hypothetical protein